MFMQTKITRLKTIGQFQDRVRNSPEAGILRSSLKLVLTTAIIGSLTACDAFSTDTKSQDEIRVEPRVLRGSDLDTLSKPGNGNLENGMVEIKAAYKPGDKQARIAVTGSNAIPYPIYPEAKQYRIGGENGLQVVLFETSDSFEDVDKFYKRYGGSQGYARLVGMADYVRYDTTRESASSSADAWKNDKPGIVIHSFSDSDEAAQSGARPDARTNIIVSY